MTTESEIPKLVSGYLREYAAAQSRRCPEPSAELVEKLRKQPQATFRVVANGDYHKPGNLDFRDLDDPLSRVLASVADLVPRLLIPRMTTGYWAARYLYISSAAKSQSAVFVPTIIALLTDRSIYIKTLVLRLVATWPHLQVADALAKLDQLAKMKSLRRSDMDRELLQEARRSVVEARKRAR